MVIPRRSRFYFFFMISSSCCRVWFCVVLLLYFVFRRFVATFYLCGRFGQVKYIRTDRDNKSDYGHQYVVKLKLYILANMVLSNLYTLNRLIMLLTLVLFLLYDF